MKDVPWFPFGLICGFYGVLGLFVLAGFVAQIWAVIDCAKRRFKDDATAADAVSEPAAKASK